MNPLLICACLWVLTAALVAMLPMRRQMVPGLALLMATPILIVWIGFSYGWIPGVLALGAFVSMFRRPLAHLARRMSGHCAPHSKESP